MVNHALKYALIGLGLIWLLFFEQVVGLPWLFLFISGYLLSDLAYPYSLGLVLLQVGLLVAVYHLPILILMAILGLGLVFLRTGWLSFRRAWVAGIYSLTIGAIIGIVLNREVSTWLLASTTLSWILILLLVTVLSRQLLKRHHVYKL